MNNNRGRSPRRAEVREYRRISRHFEASHTITTAERTVYHDSFTVKRDVKQDANDDYILPGKLDAYVKSNEGRLLSFLGVSVMNPRDGLTVKQRLEHGEGTFDINKVEDIVQQNFATPLTAFITNIAIHGAAPERPGDRFVVLALDNITKDCIRSEQRFLYTDLGFPKELPARRAHISLLQTTNQHEALAVKDELTDLQLRGSPIELQPARVIPVWCESKRQ
ncbi:MAG: hypothetical protein ACR2FM_05895 [Candidatus Saccharimonadales bacterium]